MSGPQSNSYRLYVPVASPVVETATHSAYDSPVAGVATNCESSQRFAYWSYTTPGSPSLRCLVHHPRGVAVVVHGALAVRARPQRVDRRRVPQRRTRLRVDGEVGVDHLHELRRTDRAVRVRR